MSKHDISFDEAVKIARKREGAAIRQAMADLTEAAERGEPMDWNPAHAGLAEERAELVMRLEERARRQIARRVGYLVGLILLALVLGAVVAGLVGIIRWGFGS